MYHVEGRQVRNTYEKLAGYRRFRTFEVCTWRQPCEESAFPHHESTNGPSHAQASEHKLQPHGLHTKPASTLRYILSRVQTAHTEANKSTGRQTALRLNEKPITRHLGLRLPGETEDVTSPDGCGWGFLAVGRGGSFRLRGQASFQFSTPRQGRSEACRNMQEPGEDAG